MVVEIKGFRGEDVKDKKSYMEIHWVPGVNNRGGYGRWAFADFGEMFRIESEFEKRVESEFNKMIEGAAVSGLVAQVHGDPNSKTLC